MVNLFTSLLHSGLCTYKCTLRSRSISHSTSVSEPLQMTYLLISEWNFSQWLLILYLKLRVIIRCRHKEIQRGVFILYSIFSLCTENVQKNCQDGFRSFRPVCDKEETYFTYQPVRLRVSPLQTGILDPCISLHLNKAETPCTAWQTSTFQGLSFSGFRRHIYRHFCQILLGRGIGPSQRFYLHRTTETKKDAHIRLCPVWNSNRWSHCLSGRRQYNLWTVLPLWSADWTFFM
jgi:hypothetical protein